MMEYMRKTVQVKDIAEYPTNLGTRCKLLNLNGCFPYSETEEEILYTLQRLAKNPRNLEICKGSSHCGGFWKYYKDGITPFIDKDPIVLAKHDNKYWAIEGKHRSCMAIRAGVKEITANVFIDNNRQMMLPEVGTYGDYYFNYSYVGYRNHPKIVKGRVPILFVSIPKHNGFTKINEKITLLDSSNEIDTKGELRRIMDGIFYSVTVSQKTTLFLPPKSSVKVRVIIEKDHPKTKVWLLKGNLAARNEALCDMETVYRVGCFREYDQNQCNNSKKLAAHIRYKW